MNLSKILSPLKLNKKELFVFETLFLLSEAKASKLAEECSLPRQTVYSIIDKLHRLQLIAESRVGRVKLFRTSSEHIEDALNFQITSFKKSIENFQSEKELLKQSKTNNSHSNLLHYKGKIGIKYLLKHITKLYTSKKAKTFRAYTMSQFKEGFEDEFEEFIIARSKADTESKIFVPKGTDFRKILGFNKYKREFKVLDMEDFGSALYIAGKQVYLVSYKDNEGYMIENQNIALFLKEIFDIHWKNQR